MLVGSLVHPHKSTVLPCFSEPIIRQDGTTKNDCERNAVKRLFERLNRDHADKKLLIVADGLYSCGPVIEGLGSPSRFQHDFIFVAKPDDHKNLFKHFETRRQNNATSKFHYQDHTGSHLYEWTNNISLNNAQAHLRLGFFQYTHQRKDGQITTWSWVTNLKITAKNIRQLVRAARARWKIENETFNTLKNQGYQFEHNFGHGYQNLATVFAFLMLLAFFVDQLMELCSTEFKQILDKAKTRKKVWFIQRAIFTTSLQENFRTIYGRLAELFGVQLI